ncbi:MAG: FAD-dependent oxidoreductase, partial [Myxococcota bacterium]
MENQTRRVIIVGGGMAGLCSGIYLQMNGYQVQILEAHHKPG